MHKEVRHYFLAPVVAWIGANLPTIATVASVASTAYSAYSSSEQKQEATSERHRAERGAIDAATAAQKKMDTAAAGAAGLSEATRIRKRRAMASTIKTSAEGLTEAPTVGKQTLGD